MFDFLRPHPAAKERAEAPPQRRTLASLRKKFTRCQWIEMKYGPAMKKAIA